MWGCRWGQSLHSGSKLKACVYCCITKSGDFAKPVRLRKLVCSAAYPSLINLHIGPAYLFFNNFFYRRF